MAAINFEPVSEGADQGAEPDDSGCQCTESDGRYQLEIDAGSVNLVHTACGKQPQGDWWSEALHLEAIPVTVTFENNCTGWHESSCDCDFWAQIAIAADQT